MEGFEGKGIGKHMPPISQNTAPRSGHIRFHADREEKKARQELIRASSGGTSLCKIWVDLNLSCPEILSKQLYDTRIPGGKR